MQYLSTRGQAPPVHLDEALTAGLAPDGGLYVPEALPLFTAGDFAAPGGLPELAARFLAPFFVGSALAPQLEQICAQALSIPIRCARLVDGLQVLELFHGPTAAFKDFAARFLAECMARLRHADAPLTTVLVATSGDTGAAVAAAFYRRPGFRVVILYPDGRVSPRQAHHLGAFGDNVLACAVAGNFDDCQALVKQAFADQALRAAHPLASANSISLGRLLPQMAYYAWAALQPDMSGQRWIIPTGNLGNALAAILTQAMGLPLRSIVLATNANPTLSEFLAGAAYQGRPSIATLANAMDVGAPSNAERLRHFFSDAELRERFQAIAVDDLRIREQIRWADTRYGYLACPHTACAFAVREQLGDAGSTGDVLVATAHPAKFPEVVEPLICRSIAPPPALATWLERPSAAVHLPNDAKALHAVLRS